MKTARWVADTHPIGRLRIPRIGYEELVLEGTPRNLAFGPARLMNAAALGQGGNVVLAGHRTSWFLPLKDVRAGDGVELCWRDRVTGRETGAGYRVTQVVVVDRGDRRFLAPTGEDVLTLITCYPFGSAPTSPQRYVVRAALAPGAAAAQLSTAAAGPRGAAPGLSPPWGVSKRAGGASRLGQSATVTSAVPKARRRPDTTRAMSTYWYASGHYVLLCLTPQHPAPGRYLGRAELTRSEFELVKRIVEQEPIPPAAYMH